MRIPRFAQSRSAGLALCCSLLFGLAGCGESAEPVATSAEDFPGPFAEDFEEQIEADFPEEFDQDFPSGFDRDFAAEFEDEYPAAFEGDFQAGFDSEYEGGYEQAYPSGEPGYGYDEPGAFRGEAEAGGVPITSGTVDTSGGGNSVYSVGGKVIELP